MAEYEGYTGVWRRLKSGAAIFIRDGEDIKKAVRRNFNSNKMREKADALIDKESDLTHKLYSSREKKDMLLKEKGELSKEYADAEVMEKTYKRERDNTYYERMEIEDNIRKLGSINRKGFNIKQEQANRLKEVGNTKKSLADLRKAVKEYDEKKGKDGSISLKAEIELGEEKNKFADKYGYETMKDETARVYTDIEKDKFKTQKTPKETSEYIKKRNAEVKLEKELGNYTGERKTNAQGQYDYDKEVEKYYRNMSTESISDDLESRINRMNKDLYAPNDKETYQKWNEATERYLINRMGEKKADTNRFKAEVSSKPTISDVRKELRNMESWKDEKQYGDIVISKTGHTGYHVRNVNDVSDPQTDYFAGVYGFKEKQVLNLLKERGYVQQEEVKAKVQNYRNRKGSVRQNNSGSIENLSKQALIEKLVDDQISRGVVRAENRQLQIDARKNMTKTELLKYFK